MPVLPQQPSGNPIPPGPNSVQNVCTNALYDINVVAPGEPPDPAELLFVLSKFNQLLDSWTARKIYIYASDLLSFNLVPGLVPHTIGPAPIANAPAPTFLVTGERPPRMPAINILLNNVTPIVRFPLAVRDKDWWARQTLQGIQTSLPTDFYYRPDWPLGSIFFWPVPNFAYGVELEIETLLQGAATLQTVFAFPQGYELAIELSLAELISPSFEKQVGPVLLSAAAKARMAVQGLNSAPPRINLNDFGSPSTARPQPAFNYYTGMTK
jgi:hypothetical protein